MLVSFLSSSRSLLCNPTFPALTQTLTLPIETSYSGLRVSAYILHFPLLSSQRVPSSLLPQFTFFFVAIKVAVIAPSPFCCQRLLVLVSPSFLLCWVSRGKWPPSPDFWASKHTFHIGALGQLPLQVMCFCACQQQCPRLTYTHHPARCSDQDIKDNLREPRKGERESG